MHSATLGYLQVTVLLRIAEFQYGTEQPLSLALILAVVPDQADATNGASWLFGGVVVMVARPRCPRIKGSFATETALILVSAALFLPGLQRATRRPAGSRERRASERRTIRLDAGRGIRMRMSADEQRMPADEQWSRVVGTGCAQAATEPALALFSVAVSVSAGSLLAACRR